MSDFIVGYVNDYPDKVGRPPSGTATLGKVYIELLKTTVPSDNEAESEQNGHLILVTDNAHAFLKGISQPK